MFHTLRHIPQRSHSCTLKTLLIMALCLLAILASNPALSQPQAPQNQQVVNLDKIAAVVGQGIILDSEVKERLALVYKQVGADRVSQLPAQSVMMAQVLDRMILETIQLQMAQELGIRVDTDAVTEALARVAQNNGQSLEQLRQSMLAQSIEFSQFRAQIQRELIISKLHQRVISQRVQITDQDVENYLASPVGKENQATEYRVYHLLYSVKEGASRAQLSQAQAQINQIRRQVEQGELGFSQAVLTYSDGQNASQGGDMGWRSIEQLPSLFAKAVEPMRPGSLSQPIQSGAGFHLLYLADKRGEVRKNLEQTRVRHILVSPNAIRDAAQTKALIDQIFTDLLSGNDFETLARTYSDDAATARKGGELGWVTPGTMVPSFEKVMNSQPVGAITRPFQTRYGWHILEVIERRSEDVSQELKVANAKQTIFRRKFEEELESWLQEIRQDAFVDIRLSSG